MAKRERIQWKNQSINLLAIAIGVYLAFMVSQCQESWSNERLMNRYLASLRTDLQKDLVSVREDLRTLRSQNRKCSLLLQYSQNKKILEDSLSSYLTGITTQTTFHPNPHAYRLLLGNPAVANLIDLELSRQLAELYNGTYEDLRVLDDLALQNFQTHVVARFIDGRSFPKAYLKSPAFQGLVQVNADFNRQKIEAYSKSEKQIENLLRLIDQSQP
jgi:hypothetical protein